MNLTYVLLLGLNTTKLIAFFSLPEAICLYLVQVATLIFIPDLPFVLTMLVLYFAFHSYPAMHSK
jgi:hypothetical protein